MGICEVLIPLTNSPSVEVQGNSAAALGNLSSKGVTPWCTKIPSMADAFR
jgi:Armadillo/beta-catenin-like repeat